MYMNMREDKQTLKTIFGLLVFIVPMLLIIVFVPKVLAVATYSSTNYGIDEVYMGAGSVNNAASASYQACASLGATGAGNSSSANYQANAGPCTTADPYLEFSVTNPNTDLGILSSSSTAKTTATFYVRTYLASGYIVVNASDPPSAGAGGAYHQLTNLASPTSPVTGTEQFGINLVANTGFGADPVQVPSSSYSYGAAYTDYDQTDKFKYVKGDTIAYSNSSSGETDYTISYIYNISDVTPAGVYVLNHNLVCTSTF
jgi:hypothetical protein